MKSWTNSSDNMEELKEAVARHRDYVKTFKQHQTIDGRVMSKENYLYRRIGAIGGSLALGIKRTTLIMRFLDIINSDYSRNIALERGSLTCNQ